MLGLNFGMLGDSSQLGEVAAGAIHQLGEAAAAAEATAVPRGGQNPAPASGDVNSGRSARNSGTAGSSDSAADNNASADTPPVTDPKKLAGCDPCPEDDIAKGIYNFGLWREAQANELKYSQGRIRRAYEAYSDGLDTSAGPIPLASGEDITGVVAVVVDHPDIFVFATSKLFHLKAPLLRYDDGVDTWYRWTLSESKDRLEVGEGGPGQTGIGFRSVAGQTFYDAVDKIVTSIPGVPYSATGAGRISTFKLVDGVLANGVSSSFTRHLNQGLGGACMHRKHLVSFCADRRTSGFNQGKILGLIRSEDTWSNDWEVEVQSLVPEAWQVLTFPGVHYNFSPPFCLGRFWSTISGFLEDSSGPFQSRLIDVGIGLTGDAETFEIRRWTTPTEVEENMLTSIIEPLDTLYQELTNVIGLAAGYYKEGTWDVWEYGVGLYSHNPYGLYLDSDWGLPTGLYDPSTDGWTKVGTHTSTLGWIPYTSERIISSLKEMWNGKPIPLPADLSIQSLALLSSRLDFHSSAYTYEVAYCLETSDFTQGHESCRVALPDGRSWQAALYPKPLFVPGGLGNAGTPFPSGDEDRYTTPPSLGPNDTHWYLLGSHPISIVTRYETNLIYSPAPGTYVEIPVGKAFSGVRICGTVSDAESVAHEVDLTSTEELLVPEMVWQIIPVTSLGILLMLRSDRDSLVTSYPIVEARALTDPAIILWTYEDLISRDTLSSDVMITTTSPHTFKFGAGETEWALGTNPLNTVHLRPVMKLVREPNRHILLVSTECFKKQLSTSNVPTRVEFRCLEISAEGVTEIESITSEQTASIFLEDARGMNFTPNVPIPRPRQLAAMAIADDVTYYNYDTFLRMNDPGNIDDGVVPP